MVPPPTHHHPASLTLRSGTINCGLAFYMSEVALQRTMTGLVRVLQHGLHWIWIHQPLVCQHPRFNRVAHQVQHLLFEMWDQDILEPTSWNVILFQTFSPKVRLLNSQSSHSPLSSQLLYPDIPVSDFQMLMIAQMSGSSPRNLVYHPQSGECLN